MWWIIFKLDNDLVGARIEGKEATIHWNTAEWKKELDRTYSYEEIVSMHPNNIEMGVRMVVGFSNIRDLRIVNGDINWQTYLKQNRPNQIII